MIGQPRPGTLEHHIRKQFMLAHSEVQRVIDLPRVDYKKDWHDHLDRMHAVLRRREHDDEGRENCLLKYQVAALRAAEDMLERTGWGNIIAPLLPGDGKTLISALLPDWIRHVLSLHGVEWEPKPLLVVPASLRPKTLNELADYSKDWKFTAPHVVSYTLLSRRPYLLEGGQYNIFVFDESHKLKDPRTARTKRVLRELAEDPDILVALLSASFLGTGLHDCAHWFDAALRELTPIPLQEQKRSAWARVLDVKLTDHEAYGSLVDMEPLRREFAPEIPGREGCRVAWARRLMCAPGVVMSDPDKRPASNLIIAVDEDLGLSDLTHKYIDQVLDMAERPDGEILPDPPRQWQCARNLSTGFYYRWIWPNDEPDVAWLDARRRWHKALRDELQNASKRGYDSSLLVRRAIKRGEAPGRLSYLYHAWLAEKARVCNGQDPPTEPVWVEDPEKVVERLVGRAEWLGKPAIIWVESIALQDAMEEYGVRVYRGETPPEKPEVQVCAMSWRGHGEGRNLQGWSRAYIAEPPGGAPVWDQLMARLHRRGQLDDEVVFVTPAHTRPLAVKLKQALHEAFDLQQQNSTPHRLAYADLVSANDVMRQRRKKR